MLSSNWFFLKSLSSCSLVGKPLLEPLFVFFQLVVVDHKMVSQSGCIILGRIVIPFFCFLSKWKGD